MSDRKYKRYLVITPCRDEAIYIQKTIDSVACQTVLPELWIIVDDGSTDETPKIIDNAAKKYPFIRIINRENRGKRAVGPGVIEAFNEGICSININDYNYICKMDGDLGLPPKYFEILMEKMEQDPLIGNLSGKTYIRRPGGKWISERMGDENAIGPTKFYRRECFLDIGGFVKQISWDGIDGHKCRMKGWIAGSTDEEELCVKHYRPQGSSQKNIWVGRVRWGRGKYFMGSSFIYVLAASVYRIFEYPYVIGAVGILFGYLSASLKKEKRYDDPEYLKFFRRYELESLLKGKKKNLTKYNKKIRALAAQNKDPRLANINNMVNFS